MGGFGTRINLLRSVENRLSVKNRFFIGSGWTPKILLVKVCFSELFYLFH